MNALFCLANNRIGWLHDVEAGVAAEENSRLSCRKLLDVDDPIEIDEEAISVRSLQADKIRHLILLDAEAVIT